MAKLLRSQLKEGPGSKDYIKALLKAERILQRDPDNTDALALKGEAYETAGSYTDAIPLLTRLYNLTGDATVNLRLARAYSRTGEFKSANRLLKDYKATGSEPGELLQVYYQYLWRNQDTRKLCQVISDIFTVRPLNEFDKSALVAVLKNSQVIELSEQLLRAVVAILQEGHHSIDYLRSFVSFYLVNRFKLFSDDFDAQGLISDPIFRASAPRLLLLDPHIELALRGIRQSILNVVLKEKSASAQIIEAIYCIAMQQHLKEYCLSAGDDPVSVLEQLKTAIENAILRGSEPSSYSLLIMLYAMYESPRGLARIDKVDRKLLPQPVATILYVTCDLPAVEDQVAESMPAITSISEGASEIVRRQYEENPYPRWLTVHSKSYDSYGAYMRSLHPALSLPKQLFNAELDILNAGCGTGQHPVRTGLTVPNSKILAIDLSRRSLAYGKMKAASLNADNVEFCQADILNLDEIDRKFDVIESAGVLHHLESPLEGLRQLVKRLKPSGVMMLALYSTKARRYIKQHRDYIREKGIEPTRNNILRYRRQVLADPDSKLAKFSDLYSTSQFRDLVFHTHEHTYTWLEVEALLEQAGLKCLSVIVSENVAAQYLKRFPTDTQMNNLQNWHQFEQDHPDTFDSMMRFFAVPR